MPLSFPRLGSNRAAVSRVGASLGALVIAAGLASGALAQEAPAPAAEAEPQPQAEAAPQAPPSPTVTVARVVVRGNQRIDTQTIASYLPIQPGDTVDPATLDVALRTLYRTDLFSDVQIFAEGADLVVEVVENPVINQVTFEGNEAITEEKLREEVQIRPRGVYTRARVLQDVQRLVELYRRSGRITATITPKIVQLSQNRVDLVFEIDEGVATGIRSINILGNEAFSDRDLRDIMVTKTSRLWRLFSSNDVYDPDRLEYDREQITKHYRNNGYFDFRIVSAVAELSPDREDFAVTMTVDEGAQFNFGRVTVETANERLNPEFLQALLPIREGDLYQVDRIEEAVDSLTFAAGSAGYAFVDVRPEYTPNRENNTIDVVFHVSEGQRVYVERIDIVGNTRTLDPVIRREIMLAEGDAFNQVLVNRSELNLQGLGFFAESSIENVPGSAPDRTVVQVQVQEQPTGELSFGAGFSSLESFVIDVSVTERNFRGRGQNLVARVSYGSLRQQIDFRFTEPKFLGRDLRAGFDLYHYRYDYSDFSSFNWQSTGGAVRLSWPLNGISTLSTRYSLRQDEVTVPDGYCDASGLGSQALCEQLGSVITSAPGYTLAFNATNNPVRPTRGWSGALRQDFAGLGGDVHSIRTEIEANFYHGFTENFVLSVEGSLGYVAGWSGDPVRINDRFFRGGSNFRGFETAGMGPRDLLTRDSLGANFYSQLTTELTVPNGLPEEYGVRTSLFLDVGTAGLLDDRYKLLSNGMPDPNIVDNLGLRAAAGLSVSWRSPMGPIRFDFSQILAKEDYDRTETFRFSSTTPF
ncbi:outer membrane protein assembly factor BamA [Brevundimonas sp. 2R-24]|uniref:Outer membrane protein assembly factor BamA n=1 Tax=Peiella sedimenti TaxID=3061083 RepID=A0ABT8SPQ9_9CAUL|nr:outer membrane protein assembly factor BamA [Caulobacteraceae bacterium XZ-24]